MLKDLSKVVDEVLSDHPEAVVLLISTDPNLEPEKTKKEKNKSFQQQLFESDMMEFLYSNGFDYSVAGGGSGSAGAGSGTDAITAINPAP